MAHRPADSAGRQRTPGRYHLADKTVSRLGYGAIQLSGDGVFGPSRDRDEAVAVLRAAVDAGVNHIDTAQTYGAGEVNELIREALYPYPDDLAFVSKVAARRDEAGALLSKDDSDQLRSDIEENLARGHLLRALEVTEIVCVQNFFNLADRNSLPIVNECSVRRIAFVPFCPLGYQQTQREAIVANRAVTAVAARHGATAPQVALAWLLALGPHMLVIPGTRTRTHLNENLRACTLWLEDRDIARLDAAFV